MKVEEFHKTSDWDVENQTEASSLDEATGNGTGSDAVLSIPSGATSLSILSTLSKSFFMGSYMISVVKLCILKTFFSYPNVLVLCLRFLHLI